MLTQTLCAHGVISSICPGPELWSQNDEKSLDPKVLQELSWELILLDGKLNKQHKRLWQWLGQPGPGPVSCGHLVLPGNVHSPQVYFSFTGAVKWWWCLKSRGRKATIYWTLPMCCALSHNYIILFVFAAILGGGFYYPNVTDGKIEILGERVTCGRSVIWHVTHGASLWNYFEQFREIKLEVVLHFLEK